MSKVEVLIGKTVCWNNNKLKLLDEDEQKLEEQLDFISDDVKFLFELYLKDDKPSSGGGENTNSANSWRKHSFLKKYEDRKTKLENRGTNIYIHT